MKRKVFLSMIVTLFSLICLSSSTLAWLSLAKEVFVDGMEINVSSDPSLDISLDGINFKKNLTSSDLLETIGIVNKMRNVTTINQSSFYKNIQSSKKAIKNEDYISFNLYFRTNRMYLDNLYLVDNIMPYYNYDIALTKDLDGTYIFSKGVNWNPDIDFDYGPLSPTFDGLYYSQDAIRIGVRELNIEEKFTEQLDDRKDLNSFIYDPSENKIRSYGALFGAYDYYRKKVGELEIPSNQPNTKFALSTFKNPSEARTNDSHIATFVKGNDGYKYAHIEINIWLEGYDADCFDAIFEDSILMQLKFRAASLVLE